MNSSESQVVNDLDFKRVLLASEWLTVRETGKGEDKGGAYTAAKVKIGAEFVRMYVSAWLEVYTAIDGATVKERIIKHLKGWVPPGIIYEPDSWDQITCCFENGLWHVTITGKLRKEYFENWIRSRSRHISSAL